MEKKRKQYFKGWYIKIQNGNTGLALIPGICMTAKGRGKAFIQVFYENKTYFIRYPLDQVWICLLYTSELRFRIAGCENS